MNLRKKLPTIFQNNPFWTDWAEEIQLELQRVKDSLAPIKDYFDPDSKDSIDELRDYYREFGMSVNIMLFEDQYPTNEADIIDYLKREANALSFIIRKKGTKDFFDHLFNRIYKLGYSYIFFTDTSPKRVSLFRALVTEDTTGSIIRELALHDPHTPFTKVYPSIPFVDGLTNSDTLDSVKQLTLDSPRAWALDSSLVAKGVQNTTHVALEFMISESVTIETVEQLVDNRYLEYLRNSIGFGRKVSQIPHFGMNLSLWFIRNSVNTIPAIGASTQCIGTVNGAEVLLTRLYNHFEITPTNEETFCYRDVISANEITRTPSFDIINISIPAKAIYPELVATVTDSGIQSYGGALSRPRIIPGSLRIYFTDINLVEYVLKDDQDGMLYFEMFEGEPLLDEGYSGTIDYDTGALTVVLQTTNHSYYPQAGSAINACYKTSQDLPVGRIEVLDDDDVSVLSATFLPMIFNSPQYHMSFTLIVDRR